MIHFDAQHASLVISAAQASQFPETTQKEVLMVGKSNVGKSSIINAMTNRKRLAYVGQTPGKTRLINFYEVNETLMLVDVPGYGFANRSHQEQENYRILMDDYFELRHPELMLILVDSRRGIVEDDIMMIQVAEYYHMKPVLIFSKTDKISKSALNSMIMKAQRQFGIDVLHFSTLNHESIDPIKTFILSCLNEE